MQPEALSRKLFSIDVTETRKGREYWRTRDWAPSDDVRQISTAQILVFPWEEFREGVPAVYPQGTSDFLTELRDAFSERYEVGFVEPADGYSEVALHSKTWRIPLLFVSAVAVPILVNVISDRIDSLFPRSEDDDIVELTIIAEGKTGRCIQIDYSGPVDGMPDAIINQVERCLPRVDKVQE